MLVETSAHAPTDVLGLPWQLASSVAIASFAARKLIVKPPFNVSSMPFQG